MKYGKTIHGKFLDRPNRFIAHVEVDGHIETVHVKNTGRCKELLLPGVEVVLEEGTNPERKTKYDLIAVYKEYRFTAENERSLVSSEKETLNRECNKQDTNGSYFYKKKAADCSKLDDEKKSGSKVITDSVGNSRTYKDGYSDKLSLVSLQFEKTDSSIHTSDSWNSGTDQNGEGEQKLVSLNENVLTNDSLSNSDCKINELSKTELETAQDGCQKKAAMLFADKTNGRKFYDESEKKVPERKLINIDSQAPNKVVYEWLQTQGFDFIKPEYVFGESRIDFFMQKDDHDFLMEVKGCTLEVDGQGYFPDAPTERGVKHLHELTNGSRNGIKCYICFVIQMEGVDSVLPNMKTHPEFGAALEEAKAAGVQVVFLKCTVKDDELNFVEQKLCL